MAEVREELETDRRYPKNKKKQGAKRNPPKGKTWKQRGTDKGLQLVTRGAGESTRKKEKKKSNHRRL